MSKIKLSQIAKVISKGTTPTSVGLSFTNKGIPFLRGEDIQGFQINEKSVKFYIDETSHKKLSRSEIRFGDVLVTIAGTIGRVSYVSSDIIANCNQAVAFIRLDLDEIDPLWLTLLLQSPEYQNLFRKYVAGGAIPNVSLQQIGSIEIPDIPLSKQQEYSFEIIQQIKELDKAKEATATINQDIKRLKHLALHDFLSPFNKTEKFKLGAKAVTTSGSTPSRGQKDYWQPAEIPWIKTGEIAFAPITKSEEYVSAKALKECSLKLLPENTVLIAMYGQGKTRGQSAILKAPATINQACFAILPNETWTAEFLQLWLMYSYQDMRNMSENRGGNQANMNGDLLNSLEVPAPSIEIQQEVVKKINDALTELETMKASWLNTAEEIKTLPNRLLAQAFNEIEND